MSAAARSAVLIPAWKDQKGLERTLAALAEDPARFDIVVVDDGSPEPITCAPRYGEHATRLHRLPGNRGIEHALNAGLDLIWDAGYEYIARLDCGDVPVSGRIGRQTAFLDDHPDVGIVGTWARCVDDDGNYLFTLRLPSEHRALLRKQRYVPALLHPTIMMRAAALREVGAYSYRYRTAEDYELFVRMARSYRLANIPEVLTEYVVSEGGTTKSKRTMNLGARLKVQRDYFSWFDPHAYLGVARTLLFLGIPFDWLVRAKRIAWR